MPEKSVLFVGLSAAEAESIPLPEGVSRAQVDSCAEALDLLALTPPALIVANQRVGGEESLDFFARAMTAGIELSAPMLFVAPKGSGVQPFLYHRRRTGYEVRYLDPSGDVHTHFVAEAPTERDYVVKGINGERLADEISRLVVGSTPTAADSGLAEISESELFELGFNQAVEVGGVKVHVQTEVIEAKPLTISTTVVNRGRAVYSNNQRLKTKNASLEAIRGEIEKIHLGTVRRVSTGELK